MRFDFIYKYCSKVLVINERCYYLVCDMELVELVGNIDYEVI